MTIVYWFNQQIKGASIGRWEPLWTCSNSKAKVKPSLARQKLKGKAQPKGKANVKGKADGQDQAQPQEPGSSSGAGSKRIIGWDCIQPSQPLGKAA